VSPHGEIRSERGQQLQGLLCVYVVGVVSVSIAWDLFFSTSISIAVPPHWLNELLLWLLLVIYLTAGWWSSGRTLGKQVLGLRVVRSDGSHLRFWRTLFRALLCASFFPVLLLALVNRRNRGLEDIVVGTVVTYDWLPESYLEAVPPMDAQPLIEIHQSADPVVQSWRRPASLA
jgi:uncharacterized RDD family membrane protein YckC